MTIADDFNIYIQFDKITADLRQIAKDKGIDLSKIRISDNAELMRKEKFKRMKQERWNYN